MHTPPLTYLTNHEELAAGQETLREKRRVANELVTTKKRKHSTNESYTPIHAALVVHLALRWPGLPTERTNKPRVRAG